MEQSNSKIKQLEKEIKDLKDALSTKPHLIKDAEGDYDIKSHIIDKQNEMIELLIKKQSEKGIK